MNHNDSEYNNQIDNENINREEENNENQNQKEINKSLSNNNNESQNEGSNSNNINLNNINNHNNSSSENETNITGNNLIESSNIDNNNIINNENIQNINNQINNDSLNNLEIEEEEEIYEPKLTFSFKLLLILNTLGYIHSFHKSYELKAYSLCLWPIINKYQFYRLFSSHFYHYGFFDYLTSMLGLFFATKYLEREIGSIYTIIFAFHGIIITSILYIAFMWIFKNILRFIEYNFIYQSGFSSIDFCLYLSYFLLKKNYRRNISFSFIDLRGIHSVYFVILLFQLITPSASIVLNFCGTFSAFLIFKIFKYISLPRNYWISDTEKIFGLNKTKNCMIKSILGYFSISDNETITNNVKEFDYFYDNINKNNKNIHHNKNDNDKKDKNKKKEVNKNNSNH